MNDVADDVIDLPTALVPIEDASLAIGLSRAEIDQQIATARRFPREPSAVQKRLLSYVTLDDESAEECMYALPRGGKPITGPSVRFAEALRASFGNCRAAARVVHVDRVEKVVIAEGIFHDLETNSATKAEIRRRIADKKGRLYTDDMIIVTGNAACSIALRNAILGGVPKSMWRRAFEQVQKTVSGNVATLSVTREKAIKALAAFGVTPEQIYTALGVSDSDDVTIAHIPILRGMFSALKNGEATVEEMFAGTLAKQDSGHQKIENPLSDEMPYQPVSGTPSAPVPDSAASGSSEAGQAQATGLAPAQTDDGIVGGRETEAETASGEEERVADTTSSGPPSIFREYWNAINAEDVTDKFLVAKATNKFLSKNTLEDEDRRKIDRLRYIRDMVLTSTYPRAEGEEKAAGIIANEEAS